AYTELNERPAGPDGKPDMTRLVAEMIQGERPLPLISERPAGAEGTYADPGARGFELEPFTKQAGLITPGTAERTEGAYLQNDYYNCGLVTVTPLLRAYGIPESELTEDKLIERGVKTGVYFPYSEDIESFEERTGIELKPFQGDEFEFEEGPLFSKLAEFIRWDGRGPEMQYVGLGFKHEDREAFLEKAADAVGALIDNGYEVVFATNAFKYQLDNERNPLDINNHQIYIPGTVRDEQTNELLSFVPNETWLNGYQGEEEKPDHLVEGGVYIDKASFIRAMAFDAPEEIAQSRFDSAIQFLVSEKPYPRHS
ncbi:MAG: hypothetical protein J2P36_33255, partial [Ktedonobacteraceae bacterium]|nr:hypothetical protein [Ktedonobacteraceae bacterium]